MIHKILEEKPPIVIPEYSELTNNDIVQIHKEYRNTYFINLDKEIGPPNEYRAAFNILREASTEDAIVLLINTDGGMVSTTVQFFNHLLKTQATTFAEVYSAYSAGAIIALSCDYIGIGKFGSMMVHSLSSGAFGKTHELDGKLKFINKFNEKIINELYPYFFTEQEIAEVISGKDIWLMEDEINKRLKNWKSIRRRLIEQEEQKEKDKEHKKLEKGTKKIPK